MEGVTSSQGLTLKGVRGDALRTVYKDDYGNLLGVVVLPSGKPTILMEPDTGVAITINLTNQHTYKSEKQAQQILDCFAKTQGFKEHKREESNDVGITG